MEENKDQTVLVQWIAAGLAIPDVRLLHGDAGYLLSNMIAKYSLAASCYRISVAARIEFARMNVDLSSTFKRSTFYGKQSPFIYEHPVPASVVRKQLLQSSSDQKAVCNILKEAGPVTVLLRTEDEIINNAGLKKSMPENWVWGDNNLSRYAQLNIELSEEVLRVSGKIKR